MTILPVIELFALWVALPVAFFFGGASSTPAFVSVPGIIFMIAALVFSIYSYLVFFYMEGRLPSIFVKLRKPVVSGPYRFIRQPQYVGYSAFLIAMILISGKYWLTVFCTLAVSLLLVFSYIGEKQVARESEEYYSYMKRIPFLLPHRGKYIEFDYTRSVPWLFMATSLVVKLLVLFLVPSRVKNAGVLRKREPFIIALAHQTHFDGPLIFYSTWRYIRFVGTAIYVERLKLLLGFGTIPVRRYAVDTTAIRQMLSTVKAGLPLGIAPEAARSWDGKALHVKNEIWKLFRMLKIPIVPVKFHGSQRLWPRWANIFSPGFATVEFGEAIDAYDPELEKKVMAFLSKRDATFEMPYRSYRHIERLLWRCPECGSVSSIKGFHSGFSCSSCGKSWKRPSVNEVIDLHERIKPGSMGLSFPIKDRVVFEGREVVGIIMEDSMRIGTLLVPYSSIRNSSIEKNIEPVFGTTGEMISFKSLNSALMWQEIVDFQIKFRIKRSDYHTELWG